MRIFLLFLFVVSLFLLSSCKKYTAAGEAFFIKPTSVTVIGKETQALSSHKITDLWLYVDGKYQGTYPFGNLLPILRKGNNIRINIFAGIKNNGISDTRIFYPFYDFITFDTLVESGKTIERSFRFNYKAATTVTLNETFDGNLGRLFTKSAVSSSSSCIYTVSESPDSFEKQSAELSLPYDGYDQIAQIESSGSGFALPGSTGNVYLELDYKSNTEFSVGLIGEDGALKPAVMVTPQENWNKIYVQLSNAVNETPVSGKYKVYVKFIKADTETGIRRVFLDNIKLLFL